MSMQLSLNFDEIKDVPTAVKKKPKRIRNKNPKKKVYRNDVAADGTIKDDYSNWHKLREYAVELYTLCGFVPFGDIESTENCGIIVWHDIYEREEYIHQGNKYIGQEFEHYEAEVKGAELLPVLYRIRIYEEVLTRLKRGMTLTQTMREVTPILNKIKEDYGSKKGNTLDKG